MKCGVRFAALAISATVLPFVTHAQESTWAEHIKSLHSVLDQLYTEMLPMCSSLISVGRGIAGIAAMWYIAARAYGNYARAEPIDLYPMLRPFVLGIAIILFPYVIGVINGVMNPTVTATNTMVNNSDKAIAALLKQKEAAVKQTQQWKMFGSYGGFGDRAEWYKYTHPDDPGGNEEGFFDKLGNDWKFMLEKASYNFRNAIKEVIAEVLQLLFAAVLLCINTMRTFNLIILAILGPLVFGLSVFDGFHHSLRHWIARYINVFLWLPIANIFGAVIGKIQENMLAIDLAQIGANGDTYFSRTDAGYLIFLVIGIFGYTTVPNIASYVMWVGGGDALTGKMTATTGMAMSATTGSASRIAGMAGSAGSAGLNMAGEGMMRAGDAVTDAAGGSHWSKAGAAFGKASQYMRNKIKGNRNDY